MLRRISHSKLRAGDGSVDDSAELDRTAGARDLLKAFHIPVAIVGAGPAGSSAANALLLAGGADVALIDRARFPRDKSCGDGLGAGVIGVLERLQLSHILDGLKRITRISINFHDHLRADINTEDHDRPSPLGYVIERTVFDHALVKAALERGAADLTGWGLKRAIHVNGRWELSLHNRADKTDRLLTCDVLIGADGARSRVRRALGMPFNDQGHTSFAVRAYIDVPYSENAVQRFDSPPWLPHPGYGWLFTDGGGRANIGLGFTAAAYHRDKVSFPDMLARYCDFLGAKVLSKPEQLWPALLPTASGRLSLAFPERRAALIGDAASMINPAIGEGIFYGMYAGLILGEQLAEAVKGSGDVSLALSNYEKAFNHAFASDYRSAWFLLKLLSHKPMLERFIRNFSASTEFCYDFTEFVMGVMPPRRSRSLPGLLATAAAPRLMRRFGRR